MSDQEQQTNLDGGASVSTAMLERLAAELASAANECCYRSDGWEEALKEKFLDALSGLVSSDLRDAERYRWLREHGFAYWHTLVGEKMDAAIDGAMRSNS